jgi:hypothetical protein
MYHELRKRGTRTEPAAAARRLRAPPGQLPALLTYDINVAQLLPGFFRGKSR